VTASALTSFGHGPVAAYEVMLALGACALVTVVAGRVAQDRLPRPRAFLWLAGTYVAAIAGARIGFAVTWLPSWSDALAALTRPDAAGFSSFGALGAAAPIGWLLARRLRLPFERLVGPLVVGGCALGALLRVGCFLAGCCHGRPTTLPWGIVDAGGAAAQAFGTGVAVHPSPLYESALLAVIALWLARSCGRAERPARVPSETTAAAWAVAAYLAGRFGLEFLRFHPATYAELSVAQWLCALLLAMAAGWAALRSTGRRTPAGFGVYGRWRTTA
jgi:phosphatidylglycerol:prolipoprotein diacylglycerol transferase